MFILSLLSIDFEELLHKMRDLPTGTMVRCSKARAMFASRACRKSIMVGMALENKQMTSVRSPSRPSSNGLHKLMFALWRV